MIRLSLNLVWLAGVALTLCATALAQTKTTAPRELTNARQLLVVTTKDWQAVDGELQRYERTRSNGPWRLVGAKIPIVVGRNGLGWGRGLHGEPASLAQGADPIKREGDGKAPAGAFRLLSAFGYAPESQPHWLNKMPYLQSKATTQCVDDSQSLYYNRIMDTAWVKNPNWRSHEDMLRKDELYRWGVIVGHNVAGIGLASVGAKREAGSCIFLHIWSGAGRGTAGCTAMDAKLMEEVLYWLDAQKQPVLVQLPEREFTRLQTAWQLPAKPGTVKLK